MQDALLLIILVDTTVIANLIDFVNHDIACQSISEICLVLVVNKEAVIFFHHQSSISIKSLLDGTLLKGITKGMSMILFIVFLVLT